MAVALLAIAALISAVVISGILFSGGSYEGNPLELSEDGGERVYIRKSSDDSSNAAADYAMKHPGMQVVDENGVIWTSALKRVEIFHLEYLDPGKYTVTVRSGNKDKMIAPGTENDYSFTIRNIADTEMSYRLMVETSVRPESVKIPIRGKLTIADKTIGPYTGWAEFTALDGISDSGVLPGRNSTTYTFSWEWPFERGQGEEIDINNAFDTMLGNMAVDQDLTVKVTLHVLARYGSPKTGDENHLLRYIIIFSASVLALVLVFLTAGRRRREDPEE